ncbi:uncharacterized protein LOC116261101 [Nymphaea colorata]|nr:uncharacterized protein LOC116261101 [Nymphaea colorata]
MYLVEEEEEEVAPIEENTTGAAGESSAMNMTVGCLPEISLHALAGNEVPQLMRVEGKLRGRTVSVLVDTGSIHNFISEKLAKALGCKIDTQPVFDVVVGDGNTLKFKGRCNEEKLEIQGHCFAVQVYTLAMVGADLVLGVHWLLGFDEVMWDFVGMRMHFTQNGDRRLTLSARKRPAAIEASNYKIFRGAAASLVLLMIPKGLPPPRSSDHRIDLQPRAVAIKLWPYRYNPFQQEVLTRLVQEMLAQGVIQPSRSPFASPALLVLKKDGSWRWHFYVDYRALNAITIKDR